MKPHDVILESAKPAELLSACPKYKPTPLLKKSVQNNSIWIKDETDRMGLGAVKALGGVYAVGSIIAKTQDLPIKTDSFFLLAAINSLFSFLTAEEITTIVVLCKFFLL